MDHFRRARDLCPLLSIPQVRLAEYIEQFQRAEPRDSYLSRAKKLRPSDIELWYLAGKQEEHDGKLEEACKSWNYALSGSGRRLPDIVAVLATKPNAAELMLQTIPPRPDYLVQAAAQLKEQKGEQSAGFKRLLEKSLDLLPNATDSTAADWRFVPSSVPS